MPPMNTFRAKVSVETKASQIVRHAAPYILAAALSVGLLAVAGGSPLAKSHKPHSVDLTGFGAVPRIELPQLKDPAPAVATAPARFFTINKVLAKLEGHPVGDTRLAARTDTLSDAAQPAAPPQGTEPFGLFTFRAPEGELWQRWHVVSFDIAK